MARWVGAMAWAAALACYVRSCYPTVAGGDAGELSHLACSLGVAHPPGYPLMIWGSRGMAELLRLAGIGRREGEEEDRVLGALGGNLLSCLCGACACWVGLETCRRWYASRGYENATEMAGIQAALAAFSPLLWQYYVQVEVFSLNNLFVCVQLLLSQMFLESVEQAKGIKGKDKARKVEELRLKAWRSSVLGAFFAGLGFSNQHAIVFYTLPIVCFVLYHDTAVFNNTARLGYWCSLLAAFLAGLSPYLLMFLSSTKGAVGSWGDQTTLTGFLTHLLRREYGTFRLYSGDDRQYTSLGRWVMLYAQDFAENFLWIGFPLLLLGSFSVLRRPAEDLFGLLLLVCLLFYWVAFHVLANIPSSDPLLLGVHKRFWIQAHLVGSMLIMPGAAFVHELVLRRKLHLHRTVSYPLVLVVVLLQVGLHASKSDQSSNRYLEVYARSILEPLPAHAIILSKGDNIANTVRYLQVCEHVRPDVRLIDQNMMCYRWFKQTQSRFLPGVTFPGEVRNCGEMFRF
eukprot:765298-Hanusia_phi.AAC.9